jgi:hypothetical protein
MPHYDCELNVISLFFMYFHISISLHTGTADDRGFIPSHTRVTFIFSFGANSIVAASWKQHGLERAEVK